MSKPPPKTPPVFSQHIGSVVPVKHDTIGLPPRRSFKRKPLHSAYDEPSDYEKNHDISRASSVQGETSLWYASNGVQTKQLKQLRAGKLRIQAECDLHGLTLSAAEQTLGEFIHRCQQQHYRVVSVIHGKGSRSEDNIPALKNLINQLLREWKAVLAFCSAMPKDGGTGTVYVLLKATQENSL